MFTGIITAIGTVVSIIETGSNCQITITTHWEDLVVGESIAVNGVCLTLLPSPLNVLCFDVSKETLRVTQLSYLQVGENVNLERALQLSARLGGHYVTGHIDTTASLLSVVMYEGSQEWVVGEFPHEEMQYLLPKGSITLNGVSLTINTVTENTIAVMLIPHTLANTALPPVGARLNVEFDYLTRIIAHQLRLKA